MCAFLLYGCAERGRRLEIKPVDDLRVLEVENPPMMSQAVYSLSGYAAVLHFTVPDSGNMCGNSMWKIPDTGSYVAKVCIRPSRLNYWDCDSWRLGMSKSAGLRIDFAIPITEPTWLCVLPCDTLMNCSCIEDMIDSILVIP